MRLLTVFLLCAGLLGAQDARHIDFTQELHGLDGKPIPLAKSGDKPSENTTLSEVSVTALVMQLDEDRSMSGATKFSNSELARKIYKAKNAILTAEEVATIKDRIGKVYPPLIVGAAWPLLDPAVKSTTK
jgi:hypothetical protein